MDHFKKFFHIWDLGGPMHLLYCVWSWSGKNSHYRITLIHTVPERVVWKPNCRSWEWTCARWCGRCPLWRGSRRSGSRSDEFLLKVDKHYRCSIPVLRTELVVSGLVGFNLSIKDSCNQGLVKGAILCFRNPYFYFRHGASQKSKDLNKVSLHLQELACNGKV